ncbi:amidohydrolase family protein [Neomesorhizobium albiziae]|nr:amidohydrolase family protein [Mesorhizobium albiziae]
MSDLTDSRGLFLAGPGVTDCHVHIFGSSRDVSEPRFPHPEESATLADVEKLGAPLGVRRYVLTQPSFLGFDNSLIMDTLETRPDDFRGVVWLAPSEPPASVAKLAAKGIAGLRFPLKYSNSVPDWSAYSDLFVAAAQSNVHVELNLAGRSLVKAVHKTLEHDGQVVLAHLGMFDRDLGPDDDPVFDAVMEAAQTRRVWIKLSAAYAYQKAHADRACERILDCVGPDRTVWGSDWPHVGPRLDRQETYATTLAWLLRIATGDAIRRQIFVKSPEKLYGFTPADQPPAPTQS